MAARGYTIEPVESAPFDQISYLVWLDGCDEALVVDPGFDPGAILEVLGRENLRLAGILTTHGHADHIAGNAAMKRAFPDAPLIVGRNESALLEDPEANLSGQFGAPLQLGAADGGVYAVGNAGYYGSLGALHLQGPIVAMAATPDGKGYWLVASDGGVFAFGDATFYGSAAGTSGDPVQRLVSSPRGSGYWIVRQNGDAVPYGDAASYQVPTQALLFKPATPGDKAVLFAFQQLGKPYIFGGNGPVGYDCSGLALASWSQGAGVEFARVADDQYNTAGVAVSLDSLQAGDLVFWGTSQTDWTSVYHTAIYVGGDKIVEATGDQVQLNQLGQWGSGDLMPNGRRP